MSPLTFSDHLAALESDGALFVDTVRRVDAAAAIPTCPTWTMRDLVLHMGEVHRWATAVVQTGAPKPSVVDSVVGPLPNDAGLADWLADGHQRLLVALQSADPDLAAFTFLADAASPLRFWARRQAHETAMHRVDAESATGVMTPFAPAFANDGIDEMLTGFVPRKHTPLHSDVARTMHVAPADADGSWLVTISAEPPHTERRAGAADCDVSGSASDILRALWNRQGVEQLTIGGDPSVLELFRENVRIRWS